MMMPHSALATTDFSQVDRLGNDLLTLLDDFRETEAVAWNDSVKGWVITRHQDVLDGFQGKFPLSTRRMETRVFGPEQLAYMQKRYPVTLKSIPNWIVNSDGAMHTRLRTLMARAFGKKVVDDLRPFAQATIEKLLDNLAGKDHVEFVEGIARQITGRVILQKFGLPETYLPKLRNWSYAFNSGLGGMVEPSPETLDKVEQSMAEMEAIFRREIADRRKAPREDFLSQLIQARDGSDSLSEEELLGICYLTIVAGHDTTLNTMTLSVAALCQNPAAKAYLVQHPDSILNSVMELMRFVSMSTAQNRIAAEDFEWHGKQIKKGQLVWLMVAAANRDARAFPSPLTLDLSRPTDRVMSFAPGIHHCIGHLLAKMQLTEFFPRFFERFPNASLADPKLEFQPFFTFRGLNALDVRLR